MSTRGQIAAVVGGWPGVASGPGRFGSIRYTLGRRELGHLHGDRIADLPLRPERARELIEAGMARDHRFTPRGSGWVTIDLHTSADSERVIELMRETYERAVARPDLAKKA